MPETYCGELHIGDSVTFRVKGPVGRDVRYYYRLGPRGAHDRILEAVDGKITVELKEEYLKKFSKCEGLLVLELWVAYGDSVVDTSRPGVEPPIAVGVYTSKSPVMSPFSPMTVAQGTRACVPLFVHDPDRDAIQFQYASRSGWQPITRGFELVGPGELKLPTDTAGRFETYLRAVDSTGRYSNQVVLSWEVMYAPEIGEIYYYPRWPVPGGPVFVFIAVNSYPVERRKEDGPLTVKVDYSVTLRGKTIRKSGLCKPGDGVWDTFAILAEGNLSVEGEVGYVEKPIVGKGKTLGLDIRAPKAGVVTEPRKSFTNAIGMKFVEIPPGEFMMGSPRGDSCSKPEEVLHGVRVTKPFFMGVYEVTNAEYELVLRGSPARSRVTHNRPVSYVHHSQAEQFCRLLSKLDVEARAGRSYRLPTEAEWEYACRAGTTTRFNVGHTLKECPGLMHSAKSVRPYDVGKFAPNAFGLYDMHGKALEWCQDAFSPLSYWMAEADDPIVAHDWERDNEDLRRAKAFFYTPNAPSEVFPGLNKLPLHNSVWLWFRTGTSRRVARGGRAGSDWEEFRSAARRPSLKAGLRVVCEVAK